MNVHVLASAYYIHIVHYGRLILGGRPFFTKWTQLQTCRGFPPFSVVVCIYIFSQIHSWSWEFLFDFLICYFICFTFAKVWIEIVWYIVNSWSIYTTKACILTELTGRDLQFHSQIEKHCTNPKTIVCTDILTTSSSGLLSTHIPVRCTRLHIGKILSFCRHLCIFLGNVSPSLVHVSFPHPFFQMWPIWLCINLSTRVAQTSSNLH